MQKTSLSRNQKKIFIISSVAGSLFILAVLLFYLPALKNISNLKRDLTDAQRQIQEINAMIGTAKTMGEGIIALKEKADFLNKKFPDKEEGSIRLLSEYARKLGIELVSISPGNKTGILNDSGKQITIEGRIYQKLPIYLELDCSYKDLLLYLEALREQLPAFISIESLEISKDTGATVKVKAAINLELYLLS